MLVPICLYCLNCSKFDPLILRKIIKIVATRCQILRLKCTKFDFGWGSAPDPAGGAYSAPPDPLAGFKGPTSKERGREGRGRVGKGGEGRREWRAGEGGEIRPAPSKYIWIDAADEHNHLEYRLMQKNQSNVMRVQCANAKCKVEKL